MKKERRNYEQSFKVMAVELCLSGKPTREVAEELGLRRSLINRWKREYAAKKEGSFPGKGKAALNPEEAEIVDLKKALREAQLERDILKKAVRIFSKSDGKSMSL